MKPACQLSILFFSLLFTVMKVSAEDRVFDQIVVSNLTAELKVKESAQPSARGVAFRQYLIFYGLDGKQVKDHGYYLSEGRKIFYLFASPSGKRPKATVVLLHGYQEHSGNLLETAGELLELGFAVALYDMPGHGLSDGKRGSIDDFSGYSSVLDDLLRVLGPRAGPFYFIGHSTACAAALELMHSDPFVFEKVIFVAPLVHISFWELIKGVYQPLSTQLKEIPRLFFDSSGDRVYEDYIRFMEYKDPLQVRSVPLKWVNALVKWNERLPDYPVISNGVCVIQGDADVVLDWKHNLDVLGEKFLRTEVHIIPGGKHILFHETPERRKQVLETIKDYLEN